MNATNDELGKLRDILYGEQMRELTERITLLESKLKKLQEETFGKIEMLGSESEQRISNQASEVDRIAAEQSEKIEKQSQSLAEKIEENRKKLEEDAKETKKREAALKTELLEMFAKLDSRKVTRSQLAQALNELGQAISNEE